MWDGEEVEGRPWHAGEGRSHLLFSRVSYPAREGLSKPPTMPEMTKQIRNPKIEIRMRKERRAFRPLDFDFGFRFSDFGLAICSAFQAHSPSQPLCLAPVLHSPFPFRTGRFPGPLTTPQQRLD